MIMDMSSSTETTQEWSKAGGSVSTGTMKSTGCSGGLTNSFTILPTLSTLSRHTFQAPPIQQTNHLEEYTDQRAFFSPQSAFPKISNPSSSMPQNHYPPPKSVSCIMGVTPLQQPSSSTANSSGSRQASGQELVGRKRKGSSVEHFSRAEEKSNRLNAPLPINHKPPQSTPQSYRLDLTPRLSILRPHCLARDCLRLWVPAGGSTRQTVVLADQTSSHEISDSQLERILDVIGSSWAQSTKETYGAGLLVFHVFCDTNNVTEDECCSVTRSLLLNFLCSCAGSYSGSSLANYTAGLGAWHLLHGRSWLIPPNKLKAVLDGAMASAPESSKQPKRQPFTLVYLTAIKEQLNLDSPLDAAVFACLTTTFYAVARLGEFTVSSIKDFDKNKHITRAGISKTTDHNGLPVTKFQLPRTKCVPVKGEEAYWAAQEGSSDPSMALENHLCINVADWNAHLFTWKHAKRLHPLSKKQLIKRLSIAARAANLPELKGHGLRIGGTLEYLLRGVPFDVVKAMGRWSSEAFTIYLWDHATILAPYIQASPVLEPFTRYTIPPIRWRRVEYTS